MIISLICKGSVFIPGSVGHVALAVHVTTLGKLFTQLHGLTESLYSFVDRHIANQLWLTVTAPLGDLKRDCIILLVELPQKAACRLSKHRIDLGAI